MNIWAELADGRRALAAYLRTVDESAWQTRSLCAEWTVREVVGHLVSLHETSRGALLWGFVRAFGRFDRVTDRLARDFAARPTVELADLLDKHAESKVKPPGFPPIVPLADLVIHTMDIRWPLGDRPSLHPDLARALLDFLTGGRGGARLLAADRPPLFRWEAEDLDWSFGSGPTVTGGSDALILAMTGRSAALDHLAGNGVTSLRDRLS